ncbi:hypothetical protein ABIE28_001600 [Devosia sp. 2618]
MRKTHAALDVYDMALPFKSPHLCGVSNQH